jgi:dihydroneopterin aldolase
MEKNIASHDLSDMMIYEGMYAQSRRFYFKQKFAYLKKIAERAYSFAERLIRSVKHIGQRSMLVKPTGFTSTAAAFYSVFAASVLISFFWFNLLLSATS